MPSARPVAARVLVALLAVALTGSAVACSSDDGGAAPSAGGGATSGGAHDHGSSEFGSSMGARTVSVDEVAELGPGPAVGETWSGLLGLNVCGRFLEPPAALDGVDGRGFATPGDGTFTLAPATEGDAGHGATFGDLARLVGVEVGTATMSLPDGVQPAVLDLGATGADDADLPLAGATLRTGDDCAEDTPGEVQLWIYGRDAVDTGDGVLQVVTDPQDVPVVEDGMAFVVALSPGSSLPTLPPSALIDRR